MRNRNYLDYGNKINKKRSEVMREMSVYCKNCGHTVLVANKDRVLCTHCGYWVYKNDMIEFRYKLREQINK